MSRNQPPGENPSGKIEFEFSTAGKSRRPAAEPFRILVLADLSARAFRDRPRLPKIQPLDFDRFDAAFAKACGELSLAGGTFSPRELDDLAPDALFRQLESFERLRDLRTRLENPKTFEEAAAELGRTVDQAGPTPGGSTAEDEESFEAILGRESARRDPVRQKLDEFLGRMVAPHVVPEAAADQVQWISTVDAALTETMRAVLSEPLLRCVEQTWRPLWRLISELELGERVELEVLDISRADLQTDFSESNSIEATALYREVVEPRPNRWAAWVADFEFGLAPEDLSILPTLGHIAARAGAPLIGGASPELVGATSFFDSSVHDWVDPVEAAGGDGLAGIWQSLRQSELAPWIALAGPRVLQRLPYGRGLDPVDAFPFEELDSNARTERLVWGNAAYAAVEMLAQAFQQNGWSFSPGDVQNTDAPFFTVMDGDGEIAASSSAQTYLPEQAAQFLEAQGITAIIDQRSTDQIFVRRFVSIAHPPKAIAGSWNG